MDLSKLKNKHALQDDLFRLAYHYSYEHSSNHQPKIQNYVALYGFCRNVCLVFLLFSWVAFITLLINILTNEGCWFNFLSTLTMLLMTYVFYCGFVKFYRRYTLEVFMAFSVLKTDWIFRVQPVKWRTIRWADKANVFLPLMTSFSLLVIAAPPFSAKRWKKAVYFLYHEKTAGRELHGIMWLILLAWSW